MTRNPPERRELSSLSVVVAAWNDAGLLRDCLRSLLVAREQAGFEIIVAHSGRREMTQMLASDFADIVEVELPPSANVPELRRGGMDRANGEIVAFIEDHATVAPRWAEALRDAYRHHGAAAVGGPVAQGGGRTAAEWGGYLFDYGRFMPPQRDGPVRDLSGLNMSFAREWLEQVRDATLEGVYEGPLFEALADRHAKVWMASGAFLRQNKAYELRATTISVYHLGRGYSSRRLRHATIGTRVACAAGSALLPAVLTWRVLSTVLPRTDDRPRVVSSIGALVILELAWSLGECIGCLAGAGRSDRQWR